MPTLLLEGPFESDYSLAIVNRRLAQAMARMGVPLSLHQRDNTTCCFPAESFLEQEKDLAANPNASPAERGQIIFAGQCASCHNPNDKDSGIPAPGLGGLFGPDGTAAFGKVLPNTKPVTVENWIEWIKSQDGTTVPARQPGGGKYQPIEDAPGSYVKMKD